MLTTFVTNTKILHILNAVEVAFPSAAKDYNSNTFVMI